MQARQWRYGGRGRGHPAGVLAALIAAVVTLVLLATATPAHAQIIDHVDVVAREKDAEIAIRFVTTIQYLRHSPPGRGRLLQVEFQVTGPLDSPIGGQLVSESRISPRTDLVPPFEVRYVAARKALTVEFKRDVSWRVSGSGDGRAILIRVPLPPGKVGKAPPRKPGAPPSRPAPSAPAAPSADIEQAGAQGLAKAREALAEGRSAQAIEILNGVLNLPPGSFSAPAQELVGMARERNGEADKARAEYELYLKLYPDTPGAARVKERLAKLGEIPKGAPAQAAAQAKKSAYGSVSSVYYRGATKYDATLVPPQPGLQPDQVSLTSTDQSSFVTSVDATGRYQSGPWDTKLVFRDTWTASLLAGAKNENRLAAAYYETSYKDRDAIVRLGRQSAPGGGVLGRFDGGWARVGVLPSVKLNAVGGRTVEYYAAPRRDLYGASVDLGPWGNSLTTSLYAVGQRLAGVVDRQAVGVEARYFDPKRNAFLLYDYDTKFRETGIAMLQANWILDAGTNIAFLYDHRRTPPLQVSNVSMAHAGAPLGELLASGMDYRELLDQSRAITPVSDLVSFGITHPLTQHWQLGGDVKLSKVGGTQAVGQLGAAPATGNLWIYTAQAIGTGVLAMNDVFVASLSLNRGKTFDGTTSSLSYVRVIDRWRLEGGLRYYGQTDLLDVRLRRWTPSVRAGYRWREQLTLEGEAGAELTRVDGPMQTENTRRHYFNIGFRWDFY